MYQLFLKTEYNKKLSLTESSVRIAIIELVKRYKEHKRNLEKINVKVLGYMIINLETDEIVERFVEPTGEVQ